MPIDYITDFCNTQYSKHTYCGSSPRCKQCNTLLRYVPVIVGIAYIRFILDLMMKKQDTYTTVKT